MSTNSPGPPPSPSSTPDLLNEYYDRLGDVELISSRLLTLEYTHEEEQIEREILRERGSAVHSSDEDFEHNYETQRNEIVIELAHAHRDVKAILEHCQASGLTPLPTRWQAAFVGDEEPSPYQRSCSETASAEGGANISRDPSFVPALDIRTPSSPICETSNLSDNRIPPVDLLLQSEPADGVAFVFEYTISTNPWTGSSGAALTHGIKAERFVRKIRKFGKLMDRVSQKRDELDHEWQTLHVHYESLSDAQAKLWNAVEVYLGAETAYKSSTKYISDGNTSQDSEYKANFQQLSESFGKHCNALMDRGAKINTLEEELRNSEYRLARMADSITKHMKETEPERLGAPMSFSNSCSKYANTLTSPLVLNYFDRMGDIGIIRDRLQDLHETHKDTLEARNLLHDRGEPLPMPYEEFEFNYSHRRQKIEQELLQGQRDAAGLLRRCQNTGFKTDRARQSSPLLNLRNPEPSLYDRTVQCRLNGKETSCFPDTGAGANYMSLASAKRQKLEINKGSRGSVKIANGKSIVTLGTVSLPFSFKAEPEIHQLDFHIVPECVHNVIIGSPFLGVTETLTRFAHRITKELRNSKCYRIRYLGPPQQLIRGTLNGNPVKALPDTGSDVILLSPEYVTQRGLEIEIADVHRRVLEFADGSLGRTKGLVRGLEWKYGDNFDEDHEAFVIDCYVLDGLDCDVLLGNDFLENTLAFTNHKDAFVDCTEEVYYAEMRLSVITFLPDFIRELRKKIRDSDGAKVESSAHELWKREQRDLLRRKEQLECTATASDADGMERQRQAYALWEADWVSHMSKEPPTDDQNTKVAGSRPSSREHVS